MLSIDKIIVPENSTLRNVMSVIEKGKLKVAIVVDKKKKLKGIITDGDIRRALLSNIAIDDLITEILIKKPIVCNASSSKDEILKTAIENQVYQIPIIDNDGILIGLEIIDDILKPIPKKEKVVLMVGGLGTRLRPLTEKIPKPMLKVGDKPILETIILNFKKYGYINIVLSVSYKAEIIKDYFGNGQKFGVNIEYINEEKRMGTAGALTLMKDILTENFFVMNGDLLTSLNFEHMMKFHFECNSIATMGLREYDFQVPYGVVNIKDKKIVGIEEKPVQNFYVNGGVYVLSKQVLKFIPDNSFFDMPTLFEILINKKLTALSFIIKDYWLDIGRIEEFEKANQEYYKVFR